MTEKTYAIAYDCDLRQPGCVLIQAALGGNVPNFLDLFPDRWLVHMTTGMKLYQITEAQLPILVEKTYGPSK